ELDPPAAAAKRLVADRLARLGDAGARNILREDAVDRREHRRERAERDGELDRNEAAPLREFGLRDAVFEVLAHAPELARIGALEAVDRLLAVADGENAAPARLARAAAGEELLDQRRHDLPLLGVGVLRLVDEDVIEAAVE